MQKSLYDESLKLGRIRLIKYVPVILYVPE